MIEFCSSIDFSSMKCTPLLLTSDRLTILFMMSVVIFFLSPWFLLTSSNTSTVFCFYDSPASSSIFCFVFSFIILNSSRMRSDVSLVFFVSWVACSGFFLWSAGSYCCDVWYAITSEVIRFAYFSVVIRFFSLSFWIWFPTAFNSQFLQVRVAATPSPNTTFEHRFF